MKWLMPVFILVFTACGSFPCAAQVTGAVSLEGPLPFQHQLDGMVATKRIPLLIVRTADPTWTIGPNRELANVLVYLKAEGRVPLSGQAPSKPVSIVAQGYLFLPRVIGVMVGQDIKFRNTDPTPTDFHGHPLANPPFAIGLGQNQEQILKLREPEIVAVNSRYFPWEQGWICCFDHPYFAVTGFDGKFSIDPAPRDGEYSIIAWHETGQTQKKKLTIKDGKATINLAIEQPPPRRKGEVQKPAPTTAPTSQRASAGSKKEEK